MRTLKNIILASAAMLLSIGGLALANDKKETKFANAAGLQTEYNAVFFHNNNLNSGNPLVYVDSDNPSSSLNRNNMTSLGSEFTVSAGFSTSGTTNLTIVENAASKKFVAIYVPIVIYAQSLPNGYSFGNPTVTFTINHSGWDDDNFSNATLFYHGNDSTAANNFISSFYSPNSSSSAGSGEAWYVGDYSKTKFTKTHTISPSVTQNINSDGNAHNTIVGYYSLYLYARKDSSSSHQLNFSMTAKINFDSAVSYEVAASTSTYGYEDIFQAFSGSGTNDTIKVWKDTAAISNLSVGSNIKTQNLVLDLNGKTVTCYYVFRIYKGSSLVIKNGNLVFVGQDGVSSGFLVNDGTLTIESSTTVSMSSPKTNNILFTNGETGVATINGATIVPGNVNMGVYNGGVLNFNAATISAPEYQFFTAMRNTGELYLGGSSVIKNITQSKTGCIYGSYNSSSYSGSSIPVTLESGTTEGITVAQQIASGKLSFTFAEYGNRYKVTYSSTGKTFTTDFQYYDLTFDIVGCTAGDETYSYRYGQSLTVYLSALEGYELPNSVTVTSNSKTLTAGKEYTYVKSEAKFIVYGTFDCFGDIIISGNGVDVSPKAKLTTWANNYLHLSSTENNGYCSDTTHHWYRTAKMNLMNLGSDVVNELATSTDATVTSYRARYEAWARANGDIEYCYENDFTHIGTNAINKAAVNDGIALLVFITLSSISGLIVLLIVKKKRT